MEKAQVEKAMSDGKLAYEGKRAAKAGMSLEKWLAQKEKLAAQRIREANPPKPAAKKPGIFSRLLEKAQKPL
ncbi:MAG: hypothetical protein ACREFP_01135 [Acetobacteraceae bacterium]